jgi:NADH-quinone oxidoreductase subunit M
MPLARMLALLVALAGFLVTIPLYTGFDPAPRTCSSSSAQAWIPRFNVNYHLGVDGISMPFILLNSLHHRAGGARRLGGHRGQVAQYMAAFLIMSGLMNGHLRRPRRRSCSTCSSRHR